MHADLVLEGGGARGVALAGAVAGFADGGVQVERVAGTSAGAIVAALAAAGANGPAIAQLGRDLDLGALVPGRLTGLAALGRGLAVLLGNGLHDHRPLKAWLSERLAEHGVTTFGDLRRDDPGGCLPPERAYRLVVVAADVSRGRRVLLPWDLPDYGLDPDRFRVVDAVAASAAIPLLFDPVRLPLGPGAAVRDDAADAGEVGVLVDGGLVANFPVDVFDRSDGRPPRWPSFGVTSAARPDGPAPVRAVRGPVGMLRATVTTALTARDARLRDDPCVAARTAFVDVEDVAALDLDLDAATRAELVARGHAAASDLLGRWDEAAYLARCR